MSVSFTRRNFLLALGSATLMVRARAADGGAAGRRMTLDLVCGNLGVKADLPTAIALAHAHGFESVALDAG